MNNLNNEIIDDSKEIFKYRNIRSLLKDTGFISIDWGQYTGAIVFYVNNTLWTIDKMRFTIKTHSRNHLVGLPLHTKCKTLGEVFRIFSGKTIFLIWEDIFADKINIKKFTIMKHEIDWFIGGLLMGLGIDSNCYYINTMCRLKKEIFGKDNEKDGVNLYIKNTNKTLYNILKTYIKDTQHTFDALFHILYHLNKCNIKKIKVNNLIIRHDIVKNIQLNEEIIIKDVNKYRNCE